jgi:hypothetical protein
VEFLFNASIYEPKKAQDSPIAFTCAATGMQTSCTYPQNWRKDITKITE